MNEKSYTKFWFIKFHIKNGFGAKPLRIRFSKVDIFIRINDRTRYLVLFGPEKYDTIYNKFRYLISQKSGITCVFLIIMQKLIFFQIMI